MTDMASENIIEGVEYTVVENSAERAGARAADGCAGYLPHPYIGSPIVLSWMKPFDARMRQVASTGAGTTHPL